MRNTSTSAPLAPLPTRSTFLRSLAVGGQAHIAAMPDPASDRFKAIAGVRLGLAIADLFMPKNSR